jgi:hypothetical protein
VAGAAPQAEGTALAAEVDMLRIDHGRIMGADLICGKHRKDFAGSTTKI